MTTHGRTSELCLEIRVSSGAGDPIEFENADGRTWRRKPTELPKQLSAAALWKRLAKDWSRRQGIDLVEELTFHSPTQAESFLTLVTELWGELMHRASA